MSIGYGMKWGVLVAAGLALSGCVVPPPGAAYDPVVYNDGYAQPATTYVDGSTYYDPYYADGGYDSYYAPAYPVVGSSVYYNVYNDRRHYGHRGYNRKLRADRRAERRADRRAERRAERRAARGERRANLTAEERAERRRNNANRGNRPGRREGEVRRRNQAAAVPAVRRQTAAERRAIERITGDVILNDGTVIPTK